MFISSMHALARKILFKFYFVGFVSGPQSFPSHYPVKTNRSMWRLVEKVMKRPEIY